jgi:endonuclease/exonuclease/phosphatase family metal-dependent hydrolase
MKLISWNTQWCRGLDGVISPERIVAEARAMADFDLLCLQEIAVHYPELTGDSADDQVARLRELLPGHEIHFGAAVQERGPDGRWRQFGNLVASRLPVLQVQHHPLPWPADAGAEQQGVRSMPRMCTVVTVLAPFAPQPQPLRVMTTHLEYHSPLQRGAQIQALHALHEAACAQALNPPLADARSTGPFQAKPHTPSTLLCGDFNLPPDAPEHWLIQQPLGEASMPPLHDLWPVVHGERPHDPTFLVHERSWGPEPMACDFVFASRDLLPRARRIEVNGDSRASDHQPVLVELDERALA